MCINICAYVTERKRDKGREKNRQGETDTKRDRETEYVQVE